MTIPTGISLRDYFAGQALASMPERVPPADYVHRAYAIADQMLVRREKDGGRRDHEIEALMRRAEAAETTLEIFRAMPEFSTMVALKQLWEMLGAENQTAAVTRINDFRGAH